MKVRIDSEKTVGKIKPMHGVGQPPFVGVDFSMFKYLKEAGIPFSRLHDVQGYYGGFRWVDIPNLFRDFNADPRDEASYDFTYTDLLITALMECGTEPFFRLGVTIENQALIKSYRLDPPSDPFKWAVVCEHVIRHYTQGWANGFYYDIKYWEIWNEPDNYEDPNENQMWRGTKEDYYELYGVTSKHLKSCFPHLKIGGYASCGFYSVKDSYVSAANSSPRYDYFITFFDGFLDYIKKNGCPLDFFSWHSYDSIENNIIYATYARKRLDRIGYFHTETTCNEWNYDIGARGTCRHAALTCAMMLAFQDTPLDSAMFYDAAFSVSIYASLFSPLDGRPFPTYYAFKAFNELYSLGNQISVETDENGVYAVGAKRDDTICIVISNTSGEDKAISPDDFGDVKRCLITCEGKTYTETELPDILPKDSFIAVFTAA